jgi:hypothetical protein
MVACPRNQLGSLVIRTESQGAVRMKMPGASLDRQRSLRWGAPPFVYRCRGVG